MVYSLKRRYRQFFGRRYCLPDDLIIGDYAFKVNTSTEFIYMFYARQGMEGDRAGLHRTPAANRRKLRD
jgi:hypothetical protein